MLDGDDVSHFLDILGNRNRRRIIQLLRQKPCFVTEISERLMISPKAVIEHLQLMEREHILASRSDERRRKYYHLLQDFNVVIQLNQQKMPVILEHQDTRTRFSSTIGSLRRMMKLRETLISNLEYLEQDIEQAIHELAASGQDIIRSDMEINLIVVLSGYNPDISEIKEITGVSGEELQKHLANLMERGIVTRENGRYRLCE
ncbi:MAG: ArsR family transcriptional regulator [Methanoculleus sp. SDB]|nr:MAG: ArsR family transcriptional regulator [Methanoculleus sp. SDB]